MLYDIKNQDVVAGGSGCACISVVMYGYLSYLLKTKKLKKILVIATGSLLNPIMTFQGKEIPGIAHAVALEICDAKLYNGFFSMWHVMCHCPNTS
jgi:stage V sporulation protein AD